MAVIAVAFGGWPIPPGWTIKSRRDDDRYDLNNGGADWVTLTEGQVTYIVKAHWVEKKGKKVSESVYQASKICQFKMTNCWCHDKLGNDFWFLPRGQCLYKDELSRLGWTEEEKVEPRTPEGTRDLDVEF